MSVRSSSSSVKTATSSVVQQQQQQKANDDERLLKFTNELLRQQVEQRKAAHANRLRRHLMFEQNRRPNLNVRPEDIFSPIRKSSNFNSPLS